MRIHSVMKRQRTSIIRSRKASIQSLGRTYIGGLPTVTGATQKWKGDLDMAGRLNPYCLVGYDPGLTIGVACLGTDQLRTFSTKTFEQAIRVEADFYGVEDFTPYRSKHFRISGDGIVTVKQIGVIEYVKPNVHLMWRSTICAMITGASNAPKKIVHQAVMSLLMGLGISQKPTGHELDAIACILTLGTTIVRNGGTIGVTDRWLNLFQSLAAKKKS